MVLKVLLLLIQLSVSSVALAGNSTSFGFTVPGPHFDFTVMGEIAAVMVGITASVLVYRKVMSMVKDDELDNLQMEEHWRWSDVSYDDHRLNDDSPLEMEGGE